MPKTMALPAIHHQEHSKKQHLSSKGDIVFADFKYTENKKEALKSNQPHFTKWI